MNVQVYWVFALAFALIIAVLVRRYRRRWHRLVAAYRQLEEYADTILQHGQGTILNVQGVVSELDAHHPVRHRVEEALSRAERELSELREAMEPHCSEQQQDRIQ